MGRKSPSKPTASHSECQSVLPADSGCQVPASRRSRSRLRSASARFRFFSGGGIPQCCIKGARRILIEWDNQPKGSDAISPKHNERRTSHRAWLTSKKNKWAAEFEIEVRLWFGRTAVAVVDGHPMPLFGAELLCDRPHAREHIISPFGTRKFLELIFEIARRLPDENRRFFGTTAALTGEESQEGMPRAGVSAPSQFDDICRRGR
jgi:hypothetical protein